MKKIVNNRTHFGIISHLGRRYGLVALVGVLVWSACTKDEEIVLRVNTQKYQGTDKTYVDEDLYTCWSDRDEVLINGASKTIVIETVNNQTRCYITDVRSSSSYWSVYPASMATTSTAYSSGTVTGLTLPATQPYSAPDGKQRVPTVMAAYLNGTTGTMDYYNACIALQITLTNDYSRPLNLSQLVVKDNLAPLNGSFSITGVNTQAPALAYAGGTTIADANKSITMSFASTALSLAPGSSTTVYVILPPTNSYEGNKFTIEVTAMDGDAVGETVYEFSQTQSAGVSGSFERNQLAPIEIRLNDPHTMVLEGKGTQENPYKISSGDDLKSMQNLVAKGYSPIGGGMPFASAYYQLDADVANVTLTGPIGTEKNNFTGHFDGKNHTNGQNHTLSNLRLAQGLFGHISQGATVCNLTVDGAEVSLSDATVAGVVCANAVGSIIDHCQVTGTVSFNNLPTSVAYVGGIVGNATAFTESHTTVRNCHMGATMTVTGSASHHFVGGIVGHLHNSSLLNSYTMTNSTSTSTTAIVNAPNAYVGGMVGRMDGDSYVVNCYFGLYDQINGTAGKTADICGEITDGAKISQCYYPNKIYATGNPGVDNLLGTFQFENNTYQANNTLVGTLLNNTVTSLGGTNSGLLFWTQGSTTDAPTLLCQ